MIVGIVGDIHEPFVHPLYMEFCSDIFSEYNVDRVHFAGDVVDHHYLGSWDTDPSGHGGMREADLASEGIEKWYKRFPKASVSVGNHDIRHLMQAKRGGITPERYIRPYNEIWSTYGWDWQMEHRFDSVVYEHGTGSSGEHGAHKRANKRRCSLVMGHIHSGGGVQYCTGPTDRIFALNVGCGIDISAYAFEYGKQHPTRETLGCGVVIDGVHAIFEIMPCGPKEKYRKPRAKGKRARR